MQNSNGTIGLAPAEKPAQTAQPKSDPKPEPKPVETKPESKAEIKPKEEGVHVQKESNQTASSSEKTEEKLRLEIKELKAKQAEVIAQTKAAAEAAAIAKMEIDKKQRERIESEIRESYQRDTEKSL
jgi:hypothetical protein